MNQGTMNRFRYLYLSDPCIGPSNLIIGFGHFDRKVAEHCCRLYLEGKAPRILFTGGIGAGSANIGMPEAIYFRQIARTFAGIPEEAFILETESTNTLENVKQTRRVLASLIPPIRFGMEVKQAILVATAYRQRRVWLTCRRLLPNVELYNAPPPTSLDEEIQMYAEKGEDLPSLMEGEVERIIKYGSRGDIQLEEVPRHLLRGE